MTFGHSHAYHAMLACFLTSMSLRSSVPPAVNLGPSLFRLRFRAAALRSRNVAVRSRDAMVTRFWLSRLSTRCCFLALWPFSTPSPSKSRRQEALASAVGRRLETRTPSNPTAELGAGRARTVPIVHTTNIMQASRQCQKSIMGLNS